MDLHEVESLTIVPINDLLRPMSCSGLKQQVLQQRQHFYRGRGQSTPSTTAIFWCIHPLAKILQDLQTMSTFATVKRHGALYLLKLSSPICFCYSPRPPLDLWHWCLGHSTSSILPKLQALDNTISFSRKCTCILCLLVRDRASRTRKEHSKLSSDTKILPLLGSLYFTIIMAKSQIHPPHQLVVPARLKKSLPRNTVKVLLVCRGKTWEMRYCGDSTLRRFSRGWRDFVRDNNLKVGDGCVFELVDDKELKFRVQILDGQIPKILEIGSLDKPIYID